MTRLTVDAKAHQSIDGRVPTVLQILPPWDRFKYTMAWLNQDDKGCKDGFKHARLQMHDRSCKQNNSEHSNSNPQYPKRFPFSKAKGEVQRLIDV
jgi:hypothetical protein